MDKQIVILVHRKKKATTREELETFTREVRNFILVCRYIIKTRSVSKYYFRN